MLKLFLTALFATLALVAGLVVTMLAAVASIVILAIKRWRHRHTPDPQSSQRPTPMDRVANPRDTDVIDVIATEVPADPSNR